MKIKTILLSCLLLAIISLIGACNSGNNTDDPKPQPQPTGYSWVKDGNSDYKIVLSDEANPNETLAASEVQFFIQESTSCKLPIVLDSEVNVNDGNAHYISIGQNDFTDTLNLGVSEETLNITGYKIKTKDKSIAVTGADADGYGTLFGSYKLLSYLVGFECFSDDEIALNYQKTEEWKEVDKTIVPAVGYLMREYGEFNNNISYSNRLGFVAHGVAMQNPSTNSESIPVWHNALKYLNPEIYAETHSEWFNGIDQLCLTAHGDTDSRKLMVQTVAEKIINGLEYNPGLKNFTFTQMDNNSYCNCTSCAKLYENNNGSKAAAYMFFCNDLVDVIDAYFASKGEEKDYTIYFFVYQHTFDAPVVANQDGEYEPIGEVCNKKVAPFIATYNGANWVKGFDQPENKGMDTIFSQWYKLADKVFAWTYSANFGDYLSPFNSFSAIQANTQFMKKMRAVAWLNQGATDQSVGTGFSRLKVYLDSSCNWDSDCDIRELEDKFFRNYFKNAAEPMKKMWLETINTMNYAHEVLGVTTIVPNVRKEDIFSYPTLERWMSYLDEAYKSIEKMKNVDIVLYEKLKSRIDLESISIRYLLIEIYHYNFTQSELQDFKLETKKLIQSVGLSNQGEGSGRSVANLFISWGI